jgi:hypothetical protein
LKQLIINGQTVGSIWKTSKPCEKPQKQDKPNKKHEVGRKAAPFIPDSYSDPTASAALGNIMWEQEQDYRQKKNKKRKRRHKKGHKRS